MRLCNLEKIFVYFDEETERLTDIRLQDGTNITEEMSPWLIDRLEHLALKSYWADLNDMQVKRFKDDPFNSVKPFRDSWKDELMEDKE
jgi:hypothetical protein